QVLHPLSNLRLNEQAANAWGFLLELGLDSLDAASAPDNCKLVAFRDGLVDELTVVHSGGGTKELLADAHPRNVRVAIGMHEPRISAAQAGCLVHGMLTHELSPLG